MGLFGFEFEAFIDPTSVPAAGRGSSYTSTFNSLSQEELLGKLVLLEGCWEPSAELHQLALPSIRVGGLFASDLSPILARRSGPIPPGPLPLPAPSSSVTTNGGLISPQSETYSYAGGSPRVRTAGKPIDPTKVSCLVCCKRVVNLTYRTTLTAPA